MASNPSESNNPYFTGEKETLFMTLKAKAADSQSKHSVLNDKAAYDMLKSLDYDFKKINDFGDNLTVVRAKQFDEWVKEYILANPDAVVLYLGCGLDTRITRINPPKGVSWFDVDYPEVIKLRKTFYSDKEGYKMIASSVNDTDWLLTIPGDRPTFVISEGVLEYIEKEDVKKLLNRLTSHFHQGQMAFDVMSSYAIKVGKDELKKTMDVAHKWAVDDTNEVEMLDPKLKMISELSLLKSDHIRRLSFGYQVLYGFISLFPRFKNMLRLLRYQF